MHHLGGKLYTLVRVEDSSRFNSVTLRMGGPRHPRIIRGGKGETWAGNLRDYRRVQMSSRYNTFHVNCLEPRVRIRAGSARVFLTSYCASYMRSLKSPGNA